MCSIILIYASFISAIYDKAKRLIVLGNWKYSTDIRYKMTAQIKKIINSLTLNVTPEYMKIIGFKFPNVKFNFNYL